MKPGSSSTALVAAPAGPSKPVVKPSDPYANYSTAASLGHVDADAERKKVEAERRMKEGVLGAWEVVTVLDPAVVQNAVTADITSTERDLNHSATLSGEREGRRGVEIPADDDDIRPFKLRRKTMAAGLGEIYDPGDIPIKLKPKKEEPASATLQPESSSGTSPLTISQAASTLPKWSATGWVKPTTPQVSEAETPSDEPSGVQQ